MRPKTLEERFWAKVDRSGGPDGCWIWTARTDSGGYGSINEGGKKSKHLKAHRVSYQLAYGDFDESLDICHRCDNPPCVNPAHLFAGTTTDNMRDAMRKGRYRNPTADARKAQTHCKRGHAFTPENTYITDNGKGRMCASCGRENNRQWREANRERRLAYMREWNAAHRERKRHSAA